MVKTKEEVEIKIRAKFGSVSNFLKAMAWTQYEYQKALKNPTGLHRTVARTHAQEEMGLVDVKKLNSLRGRIKAVGGPRQFWMKNKDFAYPTICNVLQGRRKRLTPLVQALFDHFGI